MTGDEARLDRERRELLDFLRAAGARGVDQAADEGRLPTLAVELALGGVRRHSLSHVARSAGLSPELARDLMRASGRPTPRPRERTFTDQDVELARLVRRFLDAGIPRSDLLEISRVMGQGMAHTADAVRRSVGDALLRPGDSEYLVGLRFAQAAEELVPLTAAALDYQFRAHLRDRIRSELVSEAERQAGKLAGSQDVAVAFADLVGYTRLGEKLPPEDLGRIAGRLTELAVDVIHRPVQLIKMIGDAAMFVSDDTPALVDTTVKLVCEVEAQGDDFPALRAGIAHGMATPRGGDWFGPPVNVASRVTNLAKPGHILATDAVAEQASEHPWKRKRRRSLKGVNGRVRLFDLDPKAAQAEDEQGK